MNKKIITIVIAFLSFSAMAQERKVAVFHPAGNASNDVKEIIREQISSDIVNTVGYTVLERQLLDKLLAEQRIQVGGLVEDSQIVEVGKLAGANLAFVSSISPLDRNLFVSVKMIDVQTARIIKQSTGLTQSGTVDLINIVRKLTSEILGNIPPPVVESKPVIVIGAFSGYKSEDWKNKTKEILINDKRFDITTEQNSPLVRNASKAYIVKAFSTQTKKQEYFKDDKGRPTEIPISPEEIEISFDIVDAKTTVSYFAQKVKVTIGVWSGINTRQLDDFINSSANQLVKK